MEKPTSSVRNWSTAVAKQFETKGLLHEFTNVPIPASKKKLNINGVEVKDKEDFNIQWKKTKKRLFSG